MKYEDIIRMAREAGFADGVVDIVGFEGFVNFANLVAAHEEKECVEMCAVLRKMAIEKEREECAKWADLVAREIDNTNNTATYIASGIRARGENEA